MNLVVRKFLFAFFAALFVVSAPLVILYTAGYRLNVTSRRVLQTGVIAITTAPRGATITLDNVPLNDRTPFVIQRLSPKAYDLRIERKNFHPWEQRINVNEGSTSYVNARLFAIKEPVVLSEPIASDLLTQKTNQQFVAPTDIQLVDKKVQVEIWRLNSEGEVLIGILPSGNYELVHDDGSSLLLINEYKTPFVVARSGGNVIELSPSLAAFSWLDDSHSLLWTDGTEVAIYDANSDHKETITRLGTPIIDVAWHPSGDSFFYGTSTQIFAAAREQYDTRPTVTLADNLTISDFWLSENGKTLYLANDQSVSALSLTE